MKVLCINCVKDIGEEDFYCPYCGYQQYLDDFDVRPQKIKKFKEKPIYSGAEVYTALNKGDKDYIGFLLTRLL